MDSLVSSAMPFQALVFDFDGLILDTETPEVEAWQAIFTRHGVEYPSERWMFTLGRGSEQVEDTVCHVLERLIQRSVDHDALNEEYELLKTECLLVKAILPGVLDLLGEARSQGLGVAVASSSHHDWVDTHLARLGILEHFDAILCADDVSRAKPFPDLYLAACSALSVSPGLALALEDSPNGITAAKEAGLYCVAVPNALTAQLDLSRADARIGSLGEIDLAGLFKLARP